MKIFEEVLKELNEKLASALYLHLYDRARHRTDHLVVASVADMVRWTGLNVRTVTKCLAELRQRRLVRRYKRGIKHSRSAKPVWRVPLADFNLDQGEWIPCPRFLIWRYLKAYPNAILLIVLLRHQHIGWQNHCWPGVLRLGTILHWSPTRVRTTIHTLSDETVWQKRKTGLPRPLRVTWNKNENGESRRHFHVLAVNYQRVPKKRGGYSTVTVSESFAEHFHVSKKVDRKST